MWKLKFGFVLRFQDPPNGLNIAKVWEENFALAKIGEELGFDACFTAQHHFIPDGYNPSPLVTLAAIGAKTSRLKLGAAIFQLPLYHPLQVAEDAAMLDVVSGGRLILGVGLSAVEREFKAFGHDIRQQGSMMDEGIEIILRAWTEDGFSFHGRHYKMSNVTLRPKPLQKPHPPLWVGGMSKGGVSRAARFGLPWVTAPQNTLDQHKRWLDVYKETAQRWGNKTHVILWRDGWVTRTETEKETAKKLWWPCIRGDRWFYFSSFPQRAWGGELPQWLKAIKSEEDFTPEHIEPELVTGTVDEVIEEIAKYKRELECDYFIFRCIFGRGPSLEPVVECLKLFASEVMPHFKD